MSADALLARLDEITDDLANLRDEADMDEAIPQSVVDLMEEGRVAVQAAAKILDPRS